jgi:hypothetical protein
MNNVLHPFLCRFVLVFFGNILIYSSSWSEHLRHVRLVLEAVPLHQAPKLHLRRPLCGLFGAHDLETGRGHGSTKGGGHPGMSGATVDARVAGILGPRRLLPTFHSRLWHNHFPADKPTAEGRVLVVAGGGGGFPRPSARLERSIGPVAVSVRQGVRRGVRHVRHMLWRDALLGTQADHILPPTYHAAPRQIGCLRARAHQHGAGRATLVVVSTGGVSSWSGQTITA